VSGVECCHCGGGGRIEGRGCPYCGGTGSVATSLALCRVCGGPHWHEVHGWSGCVHCPGLEMLNAR
jgi:hypothetical protein